MKEIHVTNLLDAETVECCGDHQKGKAILDEQLTKIDSEKERMIKEKTGGISGWFKSQSEKDKVNEEANRIAAMK